MKKIALANPESKRGSRFVLADPELKRVSGFVLTNPELKEVRGLDLDTRTRCAHYHSPLDIVAIKMRCCGIYYACKDCHVALADHPISVWPRTEFHQRAVLCGVCKRELTVQEYLRCGSRCPGCGAAFNPACASHHPIYFDVEKSSA